MNMKLFGRHLIVGLVIGLTITASTMAQESGDLGLEEMLNAEITVATKKTTTLNTTTPVTMDQFG